MNSCACCFSDFLAKCETEIRLFITLPVYASYRWVITIPSGNKYQGDLITSEDGGYTIPVADLPDGLLTQYAGEMRLEIFEAGDTTCAPVKFFVASMYDCIEFTIKGGSFEKNNLGCEVAIPIHPDPEPYLEYVAIMNQAGTDAPVATVLSNTLGGNIIWTRTAPGDYTGTLAGAFPAGKLFLFAGVENITVPISRLSDNAIRLQTPDSDGILTDTSLQIRVYP